MDNRSAGRLKVSNEQIKKKLESLGAELEEFRREFEGYHRRVVKALIAAETHDDDEDGG